MVGQGGGGGTLCVAHKERRETRVKKSKIQKFEISLKTQIQKSEGKVVSQIKLFIKNDRRVKLG